MSLIFMSSRNYRPVLLAASALLAAVLLGGCEEKKKVERKAPPPPTVLVEQARKADLTASETYTGRIEAIDTVDVRARISGYLKSRNFTQGAEVKKGDLLFLIEPDQYEVALAQAEANLESAKAARALAQITYERQTRLESQNFASKAKLDEARANLTQAIAAIAAREADVRQAKLNLGYTRIHAPMDGQIGRAAYSVGEFLTAQSNPLVKLVSKDPVFVTFPVPQRTLLEVRKHDMNRDSVFIELILPDGSTYDHKGKIEFADIQATATTDSVIVRASISNPRRLLVDRELVDVRVVRKEPVRELVIPQTGLLLDQQGAYVLAVGDDDKVTIKRIKIGRQNGRMLVIAEGLSEGDRVIVRGHQKAGPGKQVKPVSAEKSPGVSANAQN